ncbi:ADP-ribosylglycohydrolase family protein [Gottschalkiaceae bacterium SANA]|nr:ADP-ribosylglycohydrolase family protein [Gottschalkiaceae bacterium SANA]
MLIGCALGDAMGMPTEMWTREKINKRYPTGVSKFEATSPDDFFGREMVAGSVTDDTINTVMILNSIVECKGSLDAQNYISSLIKWRESSETAALVTGPSTMRALDKLEKGIPIEETGKWGTTNGAAMKIAPIGIVSDYRNLQQLIENVYQICMPTHNTNIAITGASIVAACVSYGISGGQSVEDLWSLADQVIEAAKDIGCETPSASLRFRLQAVKQMIEAETSREGVNKHRVLERVYDELGASFETIETIPAVFAIIQLAKCDPREAAYLSASLGGDTDTIGAIAGAICGAMNPDFDNSIVSELESVNALNFDKLAESILPYSPYLR